MALCKGYVLDIGAGTGCHSLALQDRGTRVLAIDVSPQALEILSKRGVEECQHADVFEFQGGPFDTLLLMMHGIGMVEDLAGLDRFLRPRPQASEARWPAPVRLAGCPLHRQSRAPGLSAGQPAGRALLWGNPPAIRVQGADGAAFRLVARGPGNTHRSRGENGLVLPGGLPGREWGLSGATDANGTGID